MTYNRKIRERLIESFIYSELMETARRHGNRPLTFNPRIRAKLLAKCTMLENKGLLPRIDENRMYGTLLDERLTCPYPDVVPLRSPYPPEYSTRRAISLRCLV